MGVLQELEFALQSQILASILLGHLLVVSLQLKCFVQLVFEGLALEEVLGAEGCWRDTHSAWRLLTRLVGKGSAALVQIIVV